MVSRVPVGLAAVLGAVLLVANMAFAAAQGTCATVDISGSDYAAFLNSVYSSKGLRTIQSIGSANAAPVKPLERNSVALIDEKSQLYYPVDLNSSAVDGDAAVFPDGRTFYGPFLIVGVIDDTLRIGKSSSSYLQDKGLQERFEGRFEFSNVSEAVSSLTELSAIRAMFTGSVGSKNRVKNVLRAGSQFSVSGTCGSSDCSDEMYSLFTKYLNIGESAQMIVEVGGGFVWKHLVPSQVKTPLYRRAEIVKTRVHHTLKTVSDAVLDSASKLSDDVKAALRGAPDEGVGGIMDKSFTPTRFKDVGIEDQEKLYTLSAYLGKVSSDAEDSLSRITRCLNAGNCKLSEDEITKLLADIRDIENVLDAVGVEMRVPAGPGAEHTSVRLSDYLSMVLKGNGPAKDVEQLQNILDYVSSEISTLKRNSELLQETLSDTAPVTASFWSAVNKNVASRSSSVAKTPRSRAALQYAFSPVTYYFLKRLTLSPHDNPFLFGDSYHVPGFAYWPAVVGRGTPLPKSWHVVEITPSNTSSASDAFVDVLVGNGSDPGDAFKSVLAISGFGIIHRFVKSEFGTDLGGFVATDEQTRMYEMKPSIITLGVVSDCPSCTLSKQGDLVSVTGSRVPALASIVEDTDPKKNGSTAILFGHHTDFHFSDGATVRIGEAIRQGKSCYETCPIVANDAVKSLFGNNPAPAMFVVSYLQSISVVASPVVTLFFSAYLLTQFKGCTDCVDTLGGYYVHLHAEPKQDTGPVEEQVNGALPKILDESKKVLEKVSPQLGEMVERFKQKAIAESIRNTGVYVQASMNELVNGELHLSKIVQIFTKSSISIPNSMNGAPAFKGTSSDGSQILFDTKNGSIKMDGRPVIRGAPQVNLTYMYMAVPGVVTPTFLVKTGFNVDPAIVFSPSDYTVRDSSFLKCISAHIPGLSADSESFAELFGQPQYIYTDVGTVAFKNGEIYASKLDWSGRVAEVDVGSDYNVTVVAYTQDISEDSGSIGVSVDTRDVAFGRLLSILFKNGAIYYRDGSIYVLPIALYRVSGSDVAGVTLSPGDYKTSMNVKFAPTPDAPEESRKSIELLNKILEEMGGINTILSENGAVAFATDANGDPVLRIYDRNATAPVTPDQLAKILQSIFAGDGRYNNFETADGSLKIYREGDSVYIQYRDPNTGQRVTLPVKEVKRDGNGNYVVKTADGREHTINIGTAPSTQPGATSPVPVVTLDGKVGGIAAPSGTVKEEKILDVGRDDKTGEIVVKTEGGEHRITVKVDSSGSPQLDVDGLLKGVVQAMQGPKGFAAYDPDSGEWSFVAGLLTPLANAFKDGIKISFNANGLSQVTPAQWAFRTNPYAPNQQAGGFNLPLLEGPELVLLLLGLAAVFALLR